MARLISKQHTNDGGYHINRLVSEANDRLKQIGKQGKRATIVAKKTSLSLQFTFKDGNGRSQKNVGLGGISVSAKGILEAEKLAQLVTGQLVAGIFTWDWFNRLIGKDTSEQTKQLTCKEMVEIYKKHYLEQRKDDKNPKGSWYQRCQMMENILGNLDKPLSLPLIRQVIESKENNSGVRATTISGLIGFLKYFNNTDYKEVIKEYRANNKVKRKTRNVPSDKRIMEVYQIGFAPKPRCQKRYLYRYPQWQFLYGLLATYGLRIHEAWNIANWDKPVTLRNGDWLAVDTDDDNKIDLQREGEDLIIPAILDPSNKEHFLCINESTKTGHRVAAPLSPEGHNWIEEFNLLQPLNLPDIKNPFTRANGYKGAYISTNKTCKWFSEHDYGFKPHDLRHAYNHRGYHLGYNPKALADSLGHSMKINSTGYLRHMSDQVKIQGIREAKFKEQNKRTEIELLREENKALKAENIALKQENELLKTNLRMYEAIEESKGKK